MNAVEAAEKAAFEKTSAATKEADEIIRKANEDAERLIKDAKNKAAKDKEDSSVSLEKTRKAELDAAAKAADKKALELRNAAAKKEATAIDAVINACF